MEGCQPPTSPAPSNLLAVSSVNFPYISSQESQHISSGGRIPTPRWGYFRCIDASIEMTDAPAMTEIPSTTHLEPGYVHKQRRRLPSPISEDESMLFSVNPISPSGMTEDVFNGLNVSLGDSCSPTANTPRVERPPAEEAASIHPRTKAKLSMGYRADCEKCRARVPGHYNHVIRT